MRHAPVLPCRPVVSRIAFVLLAALLVARPPAATAACESNTLWHGCWDGIALASAAAASGFDEGDGWSAGQPCASACYDLRAGVFEAHGAGQGGWGPGCGSGLYVLDVFQVAGAPAGVDLDFVAELQIAVTAPETADVSASIAEKGTANEASFFVHTSEPSFTHLLSIPLRKAAGQEFTLVLQLSDVGVFPTLAASVTRARLQFRGLPAGASVTSCQAYDVPVPARAASWGGVKAAYR